jgi:hypothetical protein
MRRKGKRESKLISKKLQAKPTKITYVETLT